MQGYFADVDNVDQALQILVRDVQQKERRRLGVA